jgi:uncharacterized protein (DUF1499 family)
MYNKAINTLRGKSIMSWAIFQGNHYGMMQSTRLTTMFRRNRYAIAKLKLKFMAWGIFLGLMVTLTFPIAAWAVTSSLGISDSHLASCPTSPNCVISQDGDSKHAIAAITYHVDRDVAQKTLLKVLTVVPRTEVVENTDDYIHALSKSRIFGFIDDVEFYFPQNENLIHVRSAARTGDSDLGVNRRRLEQIRLALRDLNI